MKQAMIFAAGLGTRLKPLTDYKPKALVEIGGQTLLAHTISQLKKNGFTHIVVNVHHFAEQIISYLSSNDNFGIDIKVSDERTMLLDTGGGIKHARPLFTSSSPILLHNVDILSNINLDDFYRLDPKVMCASCGVPHYLAVANLMVSPRKTKRYLVFNKEMRLVGWTNIETGEIKTPHEVVRQAIESGRTAENGLKLLAFSGVHTFSPSLFSLMESYPDKFSIMDFYIRECGNFYIRGVEKPDLKIMDVGKTDTLAEAEQFMATLENGTAIMQ